MSLWWLAILCIINDKVNGLKIGIVGGGPTGLFLSRLLRERRGNDVDDIVIFEKNEVIAPMIVSYRIDNDNNGITPNDKAIDITVNFVPARSFVPDDPQQFTGIYSRLQEIFDDVRDTFDINTTLTPELIGYYDIVDGKSETNLVFQKYDIQTQIVPQFIIGLATLYSVLKNTKTISDVYKIGICEKGETIYRWGQRNNYQVIAEYIASFSDFVAAEITNLDKTGADHSCSYLLRRSSLMSMEALRLPLLVFGINGDNPAIDATLQTNILGFRDNNPL